MRSFIAKSFRALRPRFVGTYLAMLLASAVMAILLFTGTFCDIKKDAGGNYSDLWIFSHGWPWEFMRSTVPRSEVASNSSWPESDSVPPWAYSSAWQLNAREQAVSFFVLGADLVVAAAIVLLGGLAYKFWRSRRSHVWQLTLIDLLGATAIAACCMGIWQYHHRLQVLEAEAERLADMNCRSESEMLRRSVLDLDRSYPTCGVGIWYYRHEGSMVEFRWPTPPDSPAMCKLLPSRQLMFFAHTRKLAFNRDNLKEGSDSDELILQLFPRFPLTEEAEIYDLPMDDSVAKALIQLPCLTTLKLSGRTLTAVERDDRDNRSERVLSEQENACKVSAFQNQVRALTRIQELRNLRTLSLTGDFEPEVLISLAPLSQLQSLTTLATNNFMPAQGLTNSDIKTLADSRLFPSLEELNITISHDADPSLLAQFSRVKRLTLCDHLNDEILDAVSRMPMLEEFHFESYYRSSQKLPLSVRKLAAMGDLKLLFLDSNIDVYQADFDFLQAALPTTKIKCQIVEVRIAKWKALEEREQSAKKVDEPLPDEKTADEK